MNSGLFGQKNGQIKLLGWPLENGMDADSWTIVRVSCEETCGSWRSGPSFHLAKRIGHYPYLEVPEPRPMSSALWHATQ